MMTHARDRGSRGADVDGARQRAGIDDDRDAAAWTSMQAYQLDRDIERAMSGGAEVPFRREMEWAFDTDFGSVRVTYGLSGPLSHLGAAGAAVGERIAFASSSPDRHEVAHELAHVVQVRRAGGARAEGVEDGDSLAEREAEEAATAVAAGQRAPALRHAPAARVARMIPNRNKRVEVQFSAVEWLDLMSWFSPLRDDVTSHFAGAQVPQPHARLAWSGSAQEIPKLVWRALDLGASRLASCLAPFDLLGRVQAVRESVDGGKGTPYIPEVAVIVARELENAVVQSLGRVGPRLVAAFDGLHKTEAADAASMPAIEASHPMDRVVEGVLRGGSIARLLPGRDGELEPPPRRSRIVSYRWLDDPALWNWIRTEPADATPEEVARQLLGMPERASDLRGTAPFFAVPPQDVNRIARDRVRPHLQLVYDTAFTGDMGDALRNLHHGASERALAGSKLGEEAGLAQAQQGRGGEPVDAQALASGCRAQIHFLGERYPKLDAGPRLEELKARLEDRARRLPGMAPAEAERFGVLFEKQSSVLSAVGGELAAVSGMPDVAQQFLEAAAVSDLPETARTLLDKARAQRASAPFEAMEQTLISARQSFGGGRSSELMELYDLTLTTRRAVTAGTASAGDVRSAVERIRAFELEQRIAATERQCSAVSDQLEGELGVLATIAGQQTDLLGASNRLRGLTTDLANLEMRCVRVRADLRADPDGPRGDAARQDLQRIDEDLNRLGTQEVKAALETAQRELKDMAIVKVVADIALTIGLTIVTSGIGAAAAGGARALGAGRLATLSASLGTQSAAMAAMRTLIHGDSFAEGFTTELLTNLAGFGALRLAAEGLKTLKVGAALVKLGGAGGVWKYAAKGAELTIELATQAGVQFAVAEATSLAKHGRLLDESELKALAIQGMGMFVGNAVAHRLAEPVLEQIAAYAARIGAPYRRAKVRALAEEVRKAGDPDLTKQLIEEQRKLVDEELAILDRMSEQQAATFGEAQLATLTKQAQRHARDLTQLAVEHDLQSTLNEKIPGEVWEGSPAEVAAAVMRMKRRRVRVEHENLPDGQGRYVLIGGTKNYHIYERATQRSGASASRPGGPPTRFDAHRAAVENAGKGDAGQMVAAQFPPEAVLDRAVHKRAIMDAYTEAFERAFEKKVAENPGITDKAALAEARKEAQNAARAALNTAARESARAHVKARVDRDLVTDSNGDGVPDAFKGVTRAEMDAFNIPGADGRTRGQTGREVSPLLVGKTMEEMDAILMSRGATRYKSSYDMGTKVQQVTYTYADGTIVRLKPNGDPFAQTPLYAVEMLKPGVERLPDGREPPPTLDPNPQSNISFKLDVEGRPIPKGKTFMTNPWADSNHAFRDAYDLEILYRAHLVAPG